MTRPKRLANIRDVLTSLLLVLAVSLAWPSMSKPHDPNGHPLTHHLAAVDAHGAAHHHGNPDPSPFCSAGINCCVMTHCHPGVAQSPLDMAHAALFPRHEPTAAADKAGVDPAILVPPPRLLLG